jgi:response regulator NasT
VLADQRLAPAGETQPDLIHRVMDAGVMGYVLSPFTTERLVPAIEMAVARHADNAGLP